MANELKGGGSCELSTDINVITAEINAYQRVAGEAIFEIGRRLVKVRKEKLADSHGGWTDWLRTIEMSTSQADRFMKVTAELSGGKFPTSGSIALGVMYEIATMPEESRTETHTIPSTGVEKTVDAMTVRELREVKAELKKTQEERERAESDREQAESRAKLAERQADMAIRSEELTRAQLEEIEGREKPVEIRTEYVEVEVRDETLDHRLQEYEERFGAIENYTDRPRATNLAEVTTSVMTFSKAVRDLAKRHAYLIQYRETVSALDPITRQEYNEAVTALTDLARDFGTVSGQATIIDMK